jgi:hypothetical protein
MIYDKLPLIDSVYETGDMHDQATYAGVSGKSLVNCGVFNTDPHAADDPWDYPWFARRTL